MGDSQEQYMGLSHKAGKYCLLAITNILIKTGSEHIFTNSLASTRYPTPSQPKRLLLEVLMDCSSFEKDPQMNLRFLTLVRMALKQNTPQSLLPKAN